MPQPYNDEPAKEGLSDSARLDQFYHSQEGQMVAGFLQKAMRPFLGLEADIDRLGFGYPFMCLPSSLLLPSPLAKNALPVLIPSEMGALAYGSDEAVMTAAIASSSWPIASDSMNQIIMCHGLEYCHDGEGALAEANRVLVSAGELVLMVPNRASLWVRNEATPFGHGRPFSKGQISKLLAKTGFTITSLSRALFLPPHLLRAPARLAKGMDHLGHYGWGLFGGVILVRATKLHYATMPKGRGKVMVSLSGALRPARRPAVPLSSRRHNLHSKLVKFI